MRKSIGFLTTVFLVLLLACPSNAGKIYPLGSSSASGIYFDNTTASLTGDPANVKAAIEALKAEATAVANTAGVSDAAYNADDWDGITTLAPSKNAVRDKIESLSTVYQPLDADLTTWAGVTSSANGRSLVSAADYSAMRTLLGLRPGTEVQAYDADLTSYAGVTPNANALTLLGHDFANMRTDLGLVIGTNVQAYDYELGSLSSGITGLVKGAGNGGGYAAASAGTDYLAPNGNGSQLTSVNAATLESHAASYFQTADADLGTLAAPTAWRIFYSNGSSAITELALGADGTYLKSNGASSAPTFDTPSGAAHDAVSLAASAAVLLDLATQEVSLDTQTANYIFAGPASGAAAAPTFRALGADDLPDLSATYQGTDADLTALAALATSGGAAYRTAGNTWTLRAITGTTNEITVTNGDGISGAPTISLPSTLDLSGKTLTMPSSFTQAAVASPAQTLYDSDAPGSEAADKLVAQFWAQYVDGAEDSEDSSAGIKVMIGGTLTDMLWYGHAADTVYSARDVDVTGCVYTSSGIDFDGGAAPTMNSAGRLDFDTTITGWTGGGLIYTPDGTNIRYIVDIPSGSTLTDGHTPHWDTSTNGWVLEADATGGAGTGSVTTVKEADSQVGGADIVTLDFGVGFDVAESPDTEVQISLDLAEYAGAIAGSDITLTGADTSPDAAGEIRFDSTVTGLATGALAWYDGDEVRYLVDLDVLPSNDDYVVAYDADNDNFYMKADATGGAGTPAGDGAPDGQLQYANDANDAMTAEDALYYEADTNTLYVDNINLTGTVTSTASDDQYASFNSLTGTDFWLGLDSSDSAMQMRTNATVDNSLVCEWTTTGVYSLKNSEFISNATNGSLIMGGAGGTNNESITLDFESTANTLGVSSSTGVITIALGAIGMTTSGPIEITDASTGLIIRDTEGQRYRITVSTAGVLTATEL